MTIAESDLLRKCGCNDKLTPRDQLVADIAAFTKIRTHLARRTWRFTPRLPGLGWAKRAILAAYVRGLITATTAQRLVDLSRSWEA